MKDRASLEVALASGRGPGQPYKCQAYYSSAVNGHYGTAILVPDGSALRLPDAPTWVDEGGRVVRVDCQLFHHRLSFISVYAPADPSQRAAFLMRLADRVPSDRTVVMGGDFNLTLSPQTDEARPSRHRAVGREEMQALMQRHSLVDARQDSSQPMYTHPARPAAGAGPGGHEGARVGGGAAPCPPA
jgi:exonuclease III